MNVNTAGVVYGIKCSNCTQIYIGQTGRPLKERLKEHERAIKKSDMANACARHVVNTRHTINLEDVAIVHRENNVNTRLILESYTIAANQSRLLNITPAVSGMVRWAEILKEGIQV